MAAGEFRGVDLELRWDEGQGGSKVDVRDSDSKEGSKYTPPNSEQLFGIEIARVSPFCMLVSFEWTPNQAKVSPARTGPYKALMNYFTERLKFKIDRAELTFAKYEATNIKGPIWVKHKRNAMPS